MSIARKHILIADNDERVLISLEQLLQDEGFETTTAWSTAQTLNLLKGGNFDLLLVADHPPELNCEQILRRKREEGTKIPLVVLATRPRHPFAEPYLSTLGANSFVPKQQLGAVKDAVLGMLDGGRKSAVAGRTNLG